MSRGPTCALNATVRGDVRRALCPRPAGGRSPDCVQLSMPSTALSTGLSTLKGDARMRVLVTGGAGFLGSHIVDALRARGDDVTALDDLSTGNRANLDP